MHVKSVFNMHYSTCSSDAACAPYMQLHKHASKY